jgi:DNA repair protein RadA/Sms
VSQTEARLKEAEKLGFVSALTPPRRGRGKEKAAPTPGIQPREIAHLRHLVGMFDKAQGVARKVATGGSRP